jgi:hypothetical protein
MTWIMPSLVLPGLWAGAMGHEGVSVRERNRNQGEMKLCDAVGIRLSARTRRYEPGIGVGRGWVSPGGCWSCQVNCVTDLFSCVLAPDLPREWRIG